MRSLLSTLKNIVKEISLSLCRLSICAWIQEKFWRENHECQFLEKNIQVQTVQCRLQRISQYQCFDSELFPADYKNDNRKKIKSMNECIKKCVRNKCLKSLDEYKRLPWTAEILDKIYDFAKKLMEHSPYKK